MTADIECQHISLERRRYNREPFWVLNDITATFTGGCMNLISGPTGAGKTSLLHILAGLLRPSSGQVLIETQPVSRWTGAHRSSWRRRAGIAFQQHHLFDDLTALENVMVPLVPLCLRTRELRRLARRALADVDMAELAGEKIQFLSGGERQRVNLARALVRRPQYIFADEPTAHQDNAGAAMIMRRLVEAKKENTTTVVIVAHDPRVEASHAIDTHFRLANGRIAKAG